ncbi:2484_t:CDS:10 [Diversispora eburnea]|uniref:2484_t:CDS:1 n=1 Tax=Diversispora eburnea TaxID=1213867 RepID=A0A9N9ACD7_9GLOM|nr:2484_t:CDS:10 [Diversispora eburnea]
MGKDKKSKSKKSSKNKHKKESSTRIYLSLKRDPEEPPAIPEDKNKVQVGDEGNRVEKNKNALNREKEEANGSPSNSSKTVLKLKLDPDSLASSKKQKSKRKNPKDQDEVLSKVTGKRAAEDHTEKEDEINVDDKHPTQKKSKRNNTDEDGNIYGEKTEKTAVKTEVQAVEPNVKNEVKSEIEKRSYPSEAGQTDHPNKFSKISKSNGQSTRKDSSTVASSSKVMEFKPFSPLSAPKEVNTTINVTNGNEANSGMLSFAHTGKKGPAQKLGRPPKSQAIQQRISQRNLSWQKKKKDLKTILIKLVDSFDKKDAYGFFLEPVDTSIVTDYLSVIKNPMDFGTMRKKIEKNEYTSIDQFKDDFELVCNNCRTYNAPDTIYYKSADKIWKFGEKAIEREKNNILLEEERERAGIEDGNRKLKGKKVGGVRDFMQGISSSRASSISRPIRQTRKSKKTDPQYFPDGSLIPYADPFSLIPKPPRFGNTPLLTVISTKEQRPARFEDYGPYATLGIDPPFFTPKDKDFLYNTYGDEKGYSYAKSIKSFVSDMGEEMNQQVDQFMNKLTSGAHLIDQKVARILANSDPIDSSTVTQTEFGPINIGQEINRIRKIPELKKQQAELEMCRKEKIDVDLLMGDKDIYNVVQNVGNQSFQELLDNNAKDLAQLIITKQSDNPDSNNKQILDNLSNRLIQLVQNTPESEKISRSSQVQSDVQTPVIPVPQASSSSPQPLILPKQSTSNFVNPSVERADLISVLAPSSMLHESTLPRARAKPCNYNPAGKCANCQTTDTPGWRAGETPAQKLCNACGLYYAKNRAHRPSNLWNVR